MNIKPQSCKETKIQSLSRKFQADYFVQNGKNKKGERKLKWEFNINFQRYNVNWLQIIQELHQSIPCLYVCYLLPPPHSPAHHILKHMYNAAFHKAEWTFKNKIKHAPILIFLFYKESSRLSYAVPHLDVSRVLKAWLPHIVLQMDLESLFGGFSRGAQLLIYTLDQKNILLYRGRSSSSMDCRASGGTHMEQWGRKGTPT